MLGLSPSCRHCGPGRRSSHMPVRLVAGAVMLAVLTAADDPQQCREAMASYNEMVVAVHAAVRAYEGACGRASGGTTAASTTLSSR
jgi:uncharacterized low-complexity protein